MEHKHKPWTFGDDEDFGLLNGITDANLFLAWEDGGVENIVLSRQQLEMILLILGLEVTEAKKTANGRVERNIVKYTDEGLQLLEYKLKESKLIEKVNKLTPEEIRAIYREWADWDDLI